MKTDRYICALALGQTCAWAGLFYIFPALFMRWEHAFGWSKTNLTGAFTLALLLSAAFSPLVGKLIDTGKGAVMMATSTLLGGLCLIGLSEVSKLSQFYFVWGLLGIAMSGCLYEPCFALITRAHGVHAKRAIILITLIAGFASTLCFPSAYILSEQFGWQAALQVFAGMVILVAAPLMWIGARHVEQNGENHRKRNIDRHPYHRSFLALPAFW